jgi:hypothetical protein
VSVAVQGDAVNGAGSNATYIYILVRYSSTGIDIFGATAVFAKAQGFEKQHPDNRAVMTRLEAIEKAPLKPLNNWPH